MKNILLFSDIHLDSHSLEEDKSILQEILRLVSKYNIDTVIDLGDTFDVLSPDSQEMDLFAQFIKDLNKEIIIIAAQSHESESPESSILNHYGILSDKVRVVKEFIDENHLYCGHFSLTESPKSFGATISQKTLQQYRYVFLGHIHSFYKIKPNICGLGSVKWINFDESVDKHKVVALITDYNDDKERVHFIPLLSSIPMVDIYLEQKVEEKVPFLAPNSPVEPLAIKRAEVVASQAQTQPTKPSDKTQAQTYVDAKSLASALDALTPKTKVRVIFKDYSSWLEFLPLQQKYKDKFILYKEKRDFVISDNITTKKEIGNLKAELITWLEKNKIDNSIQQILKEEIK